MCCGSHRGLWVCGSHGCPHLHGDWTVHCTYGWPYLLLATVACTAAVAYGCRALPSLPRDHCRRHPHIDCMVNGVSQAPSPRWLGNEEKQFSRNIENEPNKPYSHNPEWARMHSITLSCDILAPCWFCVHVVYKRLGASHHATRGLWQVWITHP